MTVASAIELLSLPRRRRGRNDRICPKAATVPADLRRISERRFGLLLTSRCQRGAESWPIPKYRVCFSSAVKAATAAKYHEEMVPFPGGLRIGKNGRIRPDAN